MELLSLLEKDSTLRSFFNVYLAHPIFPVLLTYDATLERIVERAAVTTEASREAVAAWVTRERYACFRRSRLYIQYRLFEQLGSGWADGALWAGRDAHAALMDFKTFLGASVGGALVDAWEELQFCKGSTEKAGLKEAKQRCLSALPIPLLPHKAGSANTWMEVWEACALERLISYWVPSYVMSGQRVAMERVDDLSSPVSVDPCRLALQEEGNMGQPLNGFLQRHGTEDELSALKAWGECLQFRNLEKMGSPVQMLLGHSFSFLWTRMRSAGTGTHLLTIQGDRNPLCLTSDPNPQPGLFPLIRDSSVAPETLWHAVNAGSWNEVCCMLDKIQEQLFPILKRVWSNYVQEDHISYGAVVLDDVTDPLSGGQTCTIVPFSGGSVLNKAHLKAGNISNCPGGVKYAKVCKRIQPSVMASFGNSSMPEGPIDALGDMDTLMAFGQFLASNYDPLSQVYLAYQLWHSILSCCKLPLANKAAQSVLKKQIYRIRERLMQTFSIRTYLRHDSTRRVELPKHTVAQIQSYVAHYVPDLSTLRTIQMAAADIFAEAISDFQRDDLCPSLPVLETSTNDLKDKTLRQQLPLPTEEDARQLTALLESSPSQQLDNFASFLQTPAATTGTANLLYFWLETHRFKEMFKEGLHMNTLWCKAEALLNKFLDMTTFTSAIPSSLIQQLQRAGEELRKFRSPQGFECFCEVLTNIQDKAFGEVLPHWRAFCCLGPQQNAVASKVTLPKITSRCPPGRKAVTTSSTSTSTTGRTLLTFTALRGVEWKEPIDM